MTLRTDTSAPSNPSPEDLRALRQAVDAAGDVIFTTDPAGTITYVNSEFVRVYGYGPDEIVGRASPRILKGGATSQEEYEAFWRRLQNRETVKREFVNRRKDGGTVQIESSANPIVLNDHLMGFMAVQRDITRRKATEAALRDSEARYRALAEAAHDSIFIVDADARIEYANAVSLERFQVSEDVIGRRLFDALPADMAERLWIAVVSVLSGGDRRYFESRLEARGGELWLGTWMVPLARHGSALPAVMGVARDITEHKRLEREFAQAQKMEAVGRLAGGVAHDFNNVLTAIFGYTELILQSVGPDSSLVPDLREISNAGERASRLTQQLLAFSRKQACTPKVVDLNEVVGGLESMLNRVIGEDVTLDVAIEPQLWHTRADPGQIEQILMNLVVNARDAMPCGGTIRVRTANAEFDSDFCAHHEGAIPGRYVALMVEDNGSGIPADVLPHVFEPFFTTKPAGKGTGLGLSTVYGIVKQNRGYVTIDSARRRGTTITIYLPQVNAEAERVRLANGSADQLSGTETILLVEDEPALRRLMQRTLECHGYTVLNALTVDDAIAIAQRHPRQIDLLLSDVVMPVLSGPELAAHIVRLRTSIKVLYVSGYEKHTFEDADADGLGAALLPKPFAPLALVAKVRECLDGVPAGGA